MLSASGLCPKIEIGGQAARVGVPGQSACLAADLLSLQREAVQTPLQAAVRRRPGNRPSGDVANGIALSLALVKDKPPVKVEDQCRFIPGFVGRGIALAPGQSRASATDKAELATGCGCRPGGEESQDGASPKPLHSREPRGKKVGL